MNRIKSLLMPICTLAAFSHAGCIFIHSSTISSSPGKGTLIGTSASDWGILMLAAPQGLTTTANNQLQGQCASGKISNVGTELNMRNFIVAQYYTVSVSAYCQ